MLWGFAFRFICTAAILSVCFISLWWERNPWFQGFADIEVGQVNGRLDYVKSNYIPLNHKYFLKDIT